MRGGWTRPQTSGLMQHQAAGNLCPSLLGSTIRPRRGRSTPGQPPSSSPSPSVPSRAHSPRRPPNPPLRAPSSLFAEVPRDGFGDQLFPGQGRFRLAVRAGGEKPRHGDGAEGLGRARRGPEEKRGVRARRGAASACRPPLLPVRPPPRPPRSTRPGKHQPAELRRPGEQARQPRRRTRKRFRRHFPEAPGNALNTTPSVLCAIRGLGLVSRGGSKCDGLLLAWTAASGLPD